LAIVLLKAYKQIVPKGGPNRRDSIYLYLQGAIEKMKKRFTQVLTGGIIVLPAVLMAQGGVVVLNDAEAARWRREVLPLPKELVIPAVRKLDPGAIYITM